MPRAFLQTALLAVTALTPTGLGFGVERAQKPVRVEVEEEFDGARLAISRSPPFPCSRDEGVPYTYDVYPHDTCLSADFPYDNNVLIVNPGRCQSDGKAPYLALYTTTSDCTGRHFHPSWYDPDSHRIDAYRYALGLPICLSNLVNDPEFTEMPGGLPQGDWSMVFRCTDKEEAPEAESAEALMTISLPPAPLDGEEQRGPRHWKAGEISDTACRVPGLSIPTHLTSYPMPDTCLELAAKRKLTIQSPPICGNGVHPRLVRYRGAGCQGEPDTTREITSDMIGDWTSCIDMGNDEEAISYSFYCTGLNKELPSGDKSASGSPVVFDTPKGRPRPAKPAPIPKPKTSSGGGSEWLSIVGIGIPFFLLFIVILSAIAAVMYGYAAAFFPLLNRIIMFFDREGREGQIAL